MKTLLSILFYCTMAGTTATVGTVLGEEAAAKVPTPITEVKKEVTKAVLAPRLSVSTKVARLKALGVRHTAAGVVVTWATSPQSLNSFLVEHAANGKDFTTIATVRASDAVAYKYCVTNGHSAGYYRIGTVTVDGQVEYSPSKKVRYPK